MPEGANTFRQQPIVRLKKRRDEGPYKSVPMILNPPSQWDQGVQRAIITYKGGQSSLRQHGSGQSVAQPDAQLDERAYLVL
jgi:hypothetical protein